MKIFTETFIGKGGMGIGYQVSGIGYWVSGIEYQVLRMRKGF